MPVQALTIFDPQQFFNLRLSPDTPVQRLDRHVAGVDISNEFSGRLSVTTVEGDRITLSADLEADYRAISYGASVQADGASVDVDTKSIEASLRQEFGVTVDGDLNKHELYDLEKLFRNVSNIFRKFLQGEDEEALAKTAKLADRFDHLSSLSSLDLSVDVERSIALFAAQLTTEVGGLSASPVSQPAPASGTSSTNTPGGAPSTVVAIPRPSTGTTAPTPSQTSTPAADSTNDGHLAVPGQATQAPSSLIEQVFAALKDAKVESDKVQEYLPDFLAKLREDLTKELQGSRSQRAMTRKVPPLMW